MGIAQHLGRSIPSKGDRVSGSGQLLLTRSKSRSDATLQRKSVPAEAGTRVLKLGAEHLARDFGLVKCPVPSGSFRRQNFDEEAVVDP